jgi:cardiolipin synthase
MNLLHWLLITLNIFLAFAAAGHALLNKRDPRAALGWIAVSLMFPLIGPILYFLFGINRVKTRARKLDQRAAYRIDVFDDPPETKEQAPPTSLSMPPESIDIAKISDSISRWPLVGGNRVKMLQNGEQAYPEMIQAIDTAEQRLFLTTYIFETNHSGRWFIDALVRAANRGVDVRVIIDGIGELYSIPRARTLLKRNGVRVSRFIPPKLWPPTVHINLRNHRKFLISDGHIAFTGGMNIGDRHLAENFDNPSRVLDVHFRLTGPVVEQIEQAFLEDWIFCTGENLLSKPQNAGVNVDGVVCRTVVDGPNEDIDKLAVIIQGAVSSARRRILIMTPYFLPSRELSSAIQTAALRGVDVSIVLPSKNNLPFVQWATNNMLWELLQRGIHVYFQPSPFVHTKMFVVDDYYALIGSANIDPRSLRLNFELNVEIYDRAFTEILAAHILHKINQAQEVFLKDVDTRSLPIRTRDALAWLFSPYL